MSSDVVGTDSGRSSVWASTGPPLRCLRRRSTPLRLALRCEISVLGHSVDSCLLIALRLKQIYWASVRSALRGVVGSVLYARVVYGHI